MKMKEFNIRIACHQFDNDQVCASTIERALLEYLNTKDIPVVVEIKETENKEI